jgi:hypothetical protein
MTTQIKTEELENTTGGATVDPLYWANKSVWQTVTSDAPGQHRIDAEKVLANAQGITAAQRAQIEAKWIAPLPTTGPHS